QHLRDEATEGMSDHGWLPLELADRVGVVIGDLLHALVSKDLRVVSRLCDAFRVIGPARCNGRIALLFKEGAPVVPTGGEEIEVVVGLRVEGRVGYWVEQQLEPNLRTSTLSG